MLSASDFNLTFNSNAFTPNTTRFNLTLNAGASTCWGTVCGSGSMHGGLVGDNAEGVITTFDADGVTGSAYYER